MMSECHRFFRQHTNEDFLRQIFIWLRHKHEILTRTMYKNLNLLVVLAVSPFFLGCQNHALQPAAAVESATPEAIQAAHATDVSFGGVSFRYNPQIFGKVVPSEIDEYLLKESDSHPDSVAPRHILFTFELAKQYNAANLVVYPIADFPRMFGKNKESKKATVKAFEDLRKVLTNKNLRFDGDIPFIPFRNGGQEFQAKVKLADFENGKGIFFVTHWSTEMALVSNDHLYYVFEGMTDDGKYYIIAEMPTNVAFLPALPPDDFEGYKEKDLYDRIDPYDRSKKNDAAEKRHELYISSITSRLEALPPDSYQPSLRHLEELISSLKIVK